MSIYPKPDKLDALPSKYALVILAAKRARQVKDGARRLTDTVSKNPLTVALDEIADDQIIPREVEDASAAAHQAALKPSVPDLDDIIGAGPVIPMDTDDSTAAQVAALRAASPDDDDLGGEDDEADEELRAVDDFTLDASDLVAGMDEEDMIPSLNEDDE